MAVPGSSLLVSLHALPKTERLAQQFDDKIFGSNDVFPFLDCLVTLSLENLVTYATSTISYFVAN